ncbi:hypothetical protein N7463_008232 [Penicillium fimorum]|uniref:Uncharacterized protein n=1 Tax=Penicillium fimorum TaxID=1882269 RepID=A0A9W9XPB1_9EURO|nr:hypothetical protein N7463_008232 [Penicillium fimorum]
MESTKETTQLLSDWVISRIDHSTQDPNFGFVETLYQTCSTALIYLWRSQFRLTLHGPHKNTLKKDVANIRLWEENFPSGHLDTIMGQSSHLKTNVVENLKEIGNILMPYLVDYDRTTTSRQNERKFTLDLAQELDTQLEKATIMLSSEENFDSSSDDELSDDSSSTTEREQNRFGRIHCYVSCLMDLVPLIDRHISRLQHKVEPRSVPVENLIRLSPGAQPFAMRIRDRFTIALTPVVERLAEANWERSVRIRSQEGAYLGDQDARTLFKPYSLFNDSGIGTSIPTRSQYAATAASHTSFLSISIAEIEAHGRPRVPSLPQEGGLPFQCDYCQKNVSLQNRIEWKMHVFADLQSYLCTHVECEDAMKTFRSRKLWADHEFNEHFTRIQWRCFKCNTTTVTQQLFVDHLVLYHDIALAGHRLTAAISEAQETVLKLEFEDYKCALCSQDGWQTKKAYATHVGRHLEEISLACLPRDETDSSEGDLNSDTSSNVTKRGLLKPFFIDNQEGHTNLGDGNIPATGLLDASSSFLDTTVHSSKKQQNMTQLGVERTEVLVNQDVETDPEAEQNLMFRDNTLFTEAGRVFEVRSSKEVQVKDTLSSRHEALSPLQQHVESPALHPFPVSDPSEDYSRPVQDVESRPKEDICGSNASSSTDSPEVDPVSLKPTSYWSVREQRDFEVLLSHFGRDFEGIARFMKTKTTLMVRNYFQRHVDSSRKDFEQIVAEAEIKKARGEPRIPLSVPSAASRRQHEATYSDTLHHRLPQADSLHSQEANHLAVPTNLSEKTQLLNENQYDIQDTPVISHTMPIMRSVTPTQSIGHGSPTHSMGQTPVMNQDTASTPKMNGDMPMDQAHKYTYLYQERLLRMRHDMSTRYMAQYGPPSQYPSNIAQVYGAGLDQVAKLWVAEVMRRERNGALQQIEQQTTDGTPDEATDETTDEATDADNA